MSKKMNNKKSLALLPLLLAAGLAAAPAQADDWSVGIAAVGISTDGARKNDFFASDGTGFELDVRYGWCDNAAVEVSYAGWAVDVGNAANPSSDDKGIDSLVVSYLFGHLTGKHQAYGLAGAGMARADLAAGSTTNYGVVNVGVGWQSAVADSMQIGGEVKLHRSSDDESVAGIDNYVDVSLAIGLRYGF